MNLKRLAVAGVTTAAVAAVPAAASAQTLIGSGSSAAQPYLQRPVQGVPQASPKVKFVYTAERRQRRRQGRPAGRSQFAINTRPPLPSDSGTTYFKLFLDGLCIVDNPKNALDEPLDRRSSRDIFLAIDQLEPRSRHRAWRQRSTRSGATRPPAVHVLPERGARRQDAGVERQPAVLGRPRRQRGRARTRTRSATSASPTPGAQSGVKALTLNGVACEREARQEAELPAVPLHLVRAAERRTRAAQVEKFARLGPHQQGRRQDHRARRRRAGVQQASKKRAWASAMDEDVHSSEEPAFAVRPARRAHARRAGLRVLAGGASRWSCSSCARRGRRSRTTGCTGSAPAERRPADPGDLHVGRPRADARLHVPRVAADLEHAADHGRGGRRSRSSCSLFMAVFIVEFAPEWMRRVLEPVVRLLASVPSVIYGLLGVLVRRAVHRQPPDQREREGVGRVRRSR